VQQFVNDLAVGEGPAGAGDGVAVREDTGVEEAERGVDDNLWVG
jgi:hypothetical protein